LRHKIDDYTILYMQGVNNLTRIITSVTRAGRTGKKEMPMAKIKA